MNRTYFPEEQKLLRMELAKLTEEHRDLDDAIAVMMAEGGINMLQIQRLKKRKLLLKDKIKSIEDQLVPDIIA